MVRSLTLISFLSLINASVPFLLLPILTFQLSVGEFGELIILETFIALITPLIQFSIAGFSVEYFKLSEIDFKKYISNTLIVLLAALLLGFFIVFVLADFFVFYFSVNKSWLLLLPFMVFNNVVVLMVVTYFQCSKQYKKYSLFLLGPNFLVLFFTLVFLFFLNLGWQSKLYANLISFLAFSLISLAVIRKELGFSYDKCSIQGVKSNLSFTLPVIPHTVLAGLYFVADRLFISEMLGNSSVAIYAAGLQLAMIMSVIQNSISRAWSPYVLEYLKGPEDDYDLFKFKYKKLYGYMAFASFIVITIGVALASSLYFLIDYILPGDYSESKLVAVYLVAGFCFLGFYKIYTPILWFHKKVGSLSKVTAFVFLINVFLNFVLIPKYGIYGACYATIVSVVCQFIFSLFLVLRIVRQHMKRVAYV